MIHFPFFALTVFCDAAQATANIAAAHKTTPVFPMQKA
jgi:hypothetical protein